jgi:hypothetical protein
MIIVTSFIVFPVRTCHSDRLSDSRLLRKRGSRAIVPIRLAFHPRLPLDRGLSRDHVRMRQIVSM